MLYCGTRFKNRKEEVPFSPTPADYEAILTLSLLFIPPIMWRLRITERRNMHKKRIISCVTSWRKCSLVAYLQVFMLRYHLEFEDYRKLSINNTDLTLYIRSSVTIPVVADQEIRTIINDRAILIKEGGVSLIGQGNEIRL